MEHIRKKSKNQYYESTATGFICNEDKNIYKNIVENQITLLTQNGTVENNQTNDKKIVSRKGS